MAESLANLSRAYKNNVKTNEPLNDFPAKNKREKLSLNDFITRQALAFYYGFTDVIQLRSF